MSDALNSIDPSSHASKSGARVRSSFGNDVFKLVSGTTFAQALLIFAAPVLTRLYSPEAFGVLAVFTSITTILGVIACLRYELAITLPEKDEEAANILGLCLLLAICIFLLTCFAVWSGGDLVGSLLNAPELTSWLWLIPPTVLLAGIFLAFNYWNTRTRHFGRLSVARIIQSAGAVASQISLGLVGRASGGALIVSGVIGQMFAVIALGVQLFRDDKEVIRESVRLQRIVAAAKRYRKFPLYDTWSALLNSVSWQLPAFLLSAFFSPAVVGYYSLGFRILQLPMSLVGSAIAQVFYPRAAEAHKNGTLPFLVETTFQRLVLIGLFPMLTLTLIGRDLYTILFGVEWVEAGIYTQLLSIWAFVWFISSPLSTLFSVLEKQEHMLHWNLANFAIRFLSLWIGGILQEPRISIFLFASTGILVYGYINLSILSTSGVPLRNVVKILATNTLIFLPAGGILLFLSIFVHKPPLTIAAAGLLVGLYALYILKTQSAVLILTQTKRDLTAADN